MSAPPDPLTPRPDEEAQLRLMIAHAPRVALALYDARTTQLLLCSPRYAELVTGDGAHSPAALRGRPWPEIMRCITPERAAALWQAALAGDQPQHLPELQHGADGDAQIWDWSLTPVVGPEQAEVRYLVASAVEITAQVQARREAERLDRLKDEFLSLASHELRTPLTSVVGYLHLLGGLLRQPQPTADDAAQSERVSRYLATLRQQMARLTRLLDDLVDVGRLQSGKFTLQHERVDLADVAQRVADEARTLSSRHLLRVEQPAEALPVWGDRERLIQVLLNLVQNAIKYAPHSERIELRLRPERGWATIEVQDYGPGIAAEDAAGLFTRFYQVARRQRSALGGLGLGLFICKQIIDQHGGTITFESRPGQGTTFCVRLPLQTTIPAGV